jgi:hypothetical protein
MDPVELAVARGKALEILKAHLDRERPVDPDSRSSYMEETHLLTWLARIRHPMLPSELRGSVLTYLKDRGCVIYRADQPAGPRGPTVLMWRIWGDGFAIIEGTNRDPGVEIR